MSNGFSLEDLPDEGNNDFSLEEDSNGGDFSLEEDFRLDGEEFYDNVPGEDGFSPVYSRDEDLGGGEEDYGDEDSPGEGDYTSGDSIEDFIDDSYDDYDEEDSEDAPSSHSSGDDVSKIMESFEDEFGMGDDDDDDGNEGDRVLTAMAEQEEEFEEEDFFGGLNFTTADGKKLQVDDILGHAFDLKASDVHISPDTYVAFSILGEIVHIKDYGILPGNVVQRAYTAITSNESQSLFAENLELDTSYTIRRGPHKGRRLRLSVGRSFGKIFMVFRTIADVIPKPEELGIPKELKQWSSLPNGLVLICGPTGTGKSTTFASLINEINLHQTKKIITVERPIEYVYPTEDAKGLITQREVGKDARSFSSALTSAMRQAPDVIMIGEVRDKEEVDSLLRASESGHLAFSTMHTNSPAGTINRIKSLYEGDEQLRVLSSLKDNVRGIANQVLVKTRDGKGRFAVHCILHVTPEVSEMIGRGDVDAIQKYMMNKKITMEHKLVQAVMDKKCDLETARSYCIFPDVFDKVLKEEMKK